ncbi:MAG: FprA family A-type flavoprotein [Bacteroidales bacterium]|nr:FprA family A-type flavoprotein [Bacteroidales bacterium]
MRLSERIRYVGVNDNQTELFERQWPLPYGVSYNSYLVVDEKVALIDTAAAQFADEFFANIKSEIGDRPIDYLIVNHMEPDHSALQAAVRREYPACQIVTNAKAVPMIEGYQGIIDNIKVIKEGESLSLGEVSLQFFMVPMVHWPETMVTWSTEENTLFSGDAFGSFKAAPADVIDSKSSTFADYQDEMTRYYASIVGKYGSPVQAALKKLNGLEIKRICSTHGPVWEQSISQVVALYDRLSRYDADRGVCLAYGSMYGNTERAALELAEAIKAKGIPCAVHNLTEEDYSFALRDVFKYDTVILGSPTYNNGIFPPVRQLMQGICDRMVKGRRFLAFGSFTWAAASVKLLNEMAAAAGFEILSEGITFRQGYSKSKFDAEAIASLL